MAPARPLVLGALFALGLARGSVAHAQTAPEAERLYNRGLEEMQTGRYASGCPLLAESQRLDPQPGALFTLAECEAKWGRLATALARYEEYLVVYARLPPSEQRVQQARQSAAIAQKIALGPQVPRLTVVLEPSAPKGTVVERDGRGVAASELGTPVPVDPGEHVVVARAPGGPEQRQSIVMNAGDVKQVKLVVAAPASVAPPAAPTSTAAREPLEQPSMRRPLAFVIGGLGIAGIVAGAVTGGLAAGKKSTIDDNCDGKFCNQDGLDAANASQSFAAVSNVAFGVGLVGLAVATILVLTEPSPPPGSGRSGRGGPTAFVGRW